MELTKEEKNAISTLERLSGRWPKSLWLFSASGSLCVMKKKDGVRVYTDREGVDPDCEVATIDIENDGGDW